MISQTLNQVCVKNIYKLKNHFNLNVRDCGSYFKGNCPIHNGDNVNAFTLYKDTGRWCCHTHSCHGNYSSASFVKLICEINHIKHDEAVSVLTELCGESIDESKQVASFFKKKEDIDNKILDDEVLEKFDGTNSFYLNRGYKQEILDYFGVLYCDDEHSKFYNRMIIPIHNRNGQLIGWTGRYAGEPTGDIPKFMHSYGLKKTKVLYNWHRAQKYFSSQNLFVVESFGAVWGLHNIGISNVVAVMGVNLSEYQAKMIIENPNIKNTIVCFDPDKAGQEAMTMFAHKKSSLSRLKNRTGLQVMNIPKDRDLDSITYDEFCVAFSNRRVFQ